MGNVRIPREGCPQIGDLRKCPCEWHRNARYERGAASGTYRPAYVDEMMVERLIYGPDPGACKAERRAAAVILLKRGHEMNHEIAVRVGLSRKTVERIAGELGLNSPRPRAEVELGGSETRAALWQLLHRGHSISGAARSLGVGSSTADYHVKILREIGVL